MEEEVIKKILIGVIVVLLLVIAFWTIINKSIKDAPVANNNYENSRKEDWDQVFNDTNP